MVLFSLLAIPLRVLGVITAPVLSYVALAVSAFSLLGTLIIGGRRATTELQRRFHI
jgi:hypothetical protein